MQLQTGLDAALRRTGRQLATGLVATPIVDVADDNGILGSVVRLDGEALLSVRPGAWAWLVFFVVLGAAFARLFHGHGATGRKLFTLAALVPVAAYWIVGGLRLSVVVSLLFLALGYVSWSVAGLDAEHDPQPR
ncbi:MAG: hypothetical protein AAGA54_24705 [Myxococcota bacterium]